MQITPTTPPIVIVATTANPVVTDPTLSKPFVCPKPVGLFPDPTNCSKYYSCGNGYAYSMSCSLDLHWYDVYQWCDYPETVQCKI